MTSTASTTPDATTTATRRSRATRAADQVVAAPAATDLASVLAAAGVSEADVAKMIKSVQPKPPKMNVKRTVGNALIKAAADLAAGWEHDEITRETATELVGKWVSYIPASEWDERLGQRPTAGRTKKDETETDETETDETS